MGHHCHWGDPVLLGLSTPSGHQHGKEPHRTPTTGTPPDAHALKSLKLIFGNEQVFFLARSQAGRWGQLPPPGRQHGTK